MEDDSSELVALSCPNHHRLLVNGLWNCFKTDQGLDSDIDVGGRKVQAHSLIVNIFLSANQSGSSPACAPDELDLLESADSDESMDQTGQHNPKCYVDPSHEDSDTKLDSLLLEFMYKGKTTARKEQLTKLLDIAKKLNFKLLIDAAEAAVRDVAEESPTLVNSAKRGMSNEAIDPNRSLTHRQGKVNARIVLNSRRASGKVSLGTGTQPGFPRCSVWAADPRRMSALAGAARGLPLKFKLKVLGPHDLKNVNGVNPFMRTRYQLRHPEAKQMHSSAKMVSREVPASEEPEPDMASVEQSPEIVEPTTTITRDGIPKHLSKKLGEYIRDAVKEGGMTGDGPAQRFSCRECDYVSHKKYSLQFHVARRHLEPRAELFRCTSCATVFLSQKAVDLHMTTKHADDPEIYQCWHCHEYKSTKKYLFVKHLGLVHSVDLAGDPIEKTFVCDKCPAAFLLRSQLSHHQRIKHWPGGKRYRCEKCNYSTNVLSDLKTHAQFKHQDVRQFVCEICGFAAKSKSNLHKHISVHTGKKPFVCAVCGNAYAYNASLKSHAVKHEEGYSEAKARTHVCHVCDKGFLSREKMVRHLKNIHNAEALSQSSASTNPP